MTIFHHQLAADFSDNGTILCHLTTNAKKPFKNLRFCFSLLDRCEVIRGGTIVNSLGGFAEIALTDTLSPAEPIELEIAYVGHGHKTMNRAWLPLAPYLKFEDGSTEAIEPMPAGINQPDSVPPVLTTDRLKLVPPPKEWQPSSGSRTIQGFRLVSDGAFPDAFQSANDLAKRNGFPALLSQKGAEIHVTKSETDAPGHYILEITSNSITLKTAGRAGAFYGAITLLNLRATYHGNLPLGTIIDGPRFSWRGQHLDCARHFYEPATLFRFVDMMAPVKAQCFPLAFFG